MKIVVAITGASGSIYAEDFLEKLIVLENQIEEIAVIVSKNANMVWQHELGTSMPKHNKIKHYQKGDFMAPFASGSADWDAMLIIPASMGTIGRIANGISDDLITRASDVMLKEQKKLIICPREMPFNQIHLKNLLLLQQAGAIILPANPSFYSKPKTIKELISTVTDRLIDHLGLKNDGSFRWGEKPLEN